MNPLVIINPNSSDQVTEAIRTAVAPLERFGFPMSCVTLAEGPPAIETQMQADLTIAPLLQLAEKHSQAAGFVIACFGDPGLHALRDCVGVPVVGIQEAAVSMALTLGQRFGVIAILPASIPRHLRAFGAMGVQHRLAGDRALGLGVAELADADRTIDAMIRTGAMLRDDDGADVLIMGCAGMAGYREALEDALGLPVVEPCQAGATLALSQIALGYGNARTGGQNA